MSAVAVTGAAGFIGRRLCARLAADGREVVAVGRRPADGPWARHVVADIAQTALPAGALDGVGCVFHLAAHTHALAERGPRVEAAYRAINVDGTRRVLDAAVAAGAARFVFFSSVKAMGEGGRARLDETSPPLPTTPYGRTKLAAEGLVLATGREFGIHAAVLRLPLVYGPGSKGNLARMLARVRSGRFPPLPETGNRRSLVHVDDVVDAALLLAERGEAAGRTYLVTDGAARSTREIHALMCAAAGRPGPGWSLPIGLLRAAARAGDILGGLTGRRALLDGDALDKLIGSAWYDAGRIERELGFRASRTLEQGLREMIASASGGGGAPERPPGTEPASRE